MIFAGCDVDIDSLKSSASASATTASEASDNTTDYFKKQSVDMGELALKESDLLVAIGARSFDVLTDSASLKKAIDSPVISDDTGSTSSDASGRYAYKNGFSFNETTLGGSAVWYFADITGSCDYSVGRGIKLGSAYADVVKAYGEPYWKETDEEGYAVTYCVSAAEGDYDSPCVIFNFGSDDKVSEIQVCYPVG